MASETRQQVRCHVQCNARSGPLHMRIQAGLSADWTVLFGPSGSGKSTLLRLISGQWSPPGSAILLNGQDLSRTPAHKRRIALVAQQPALFPNMTVTSNVAFACRTKSDREEFLPGLMEAFDLVSLGREYPARLSGGEQQRVALARAIASRPNLLLLDEAFTGMHRSLQARLIGIVRAYCTKLSTPVLSVTHDVAEAFFCSDEVLRLEAGAIVARGTAEQVLASERTALLESLR